MAAVKYQLIYLAGTLDFAITRPQSVFNLISVSDANWDYNPDDGASMALYIVFLLIAQFWFMLRLHGLSA